MAANFWVMGRIVGATFSKRSLILYFEIGQFLVSSVITEHDPDRGTSKPVLFLRSSHEFAIY